MPVRLRFNVQSRGTRYAAGLRRRQAPEGGVVQPAVYMDDAHVVKMLVAGEAAVDAGAAVGRPVHHQVAVRVVGGVEVPALAERVVGIARRDVARVVGRRDQAAELILVPELEPRPPALSGCRYHVIRLDLRSFAAAFLSFHDNGVRCYPNPTVIDVSRAPCLPVDRSSGSVRASSAGGQRYPPGHERALFQTPPRHRPRHAARRRAGRRRQPDHRIQ